MCDLDVMVAPSKLSVIRKAASLERVRPTLLLSESRGYVLGSGGQFSFSFLFLFRRCSLLLKIRLGVEGSEDEDRWSSKTLSARC